MTSYFFSWSFVVVTDIEFQHLGRHSEKFKKNVYAQVNGIVCQQIVC